jgi:hypothetical protein
MMIIITIAEAAAAAAITKQRNIFGPVSVG